MVGTSTNSSSSSSASFSSFDDVTVKSTTNTTTSTGVVKIIYSYGGRILPRQGKLRYVGGDTRVLAVDKNLPFTELQAKLGNLCGWGQVCLRYQLPADDLDALVTVTSDEDLTNIYEEYEIAAKNKIDAIKIRVFLFPRRRPLTVQLPESMAANNCFHRSPGTSRISVSCASGYPSPSSGQGPQSQRSTTPQLYVMHHGNHWQ